MVHIAKGYRRADVQHRNGNDTSDTNTVHTAKAKVGRNGKPVLVPLDVPKPPKSKHVADENAGFARNHPYWLIEIIGIVIVLVGLGVSIVGNKVSPDASWYSMVLSFCLIIGVMAMVLGPLCVWMSRNGQISPQLGSRSNGQLRQIVSSRPKPGVRAAVLAAEILSAILFAVLSYLCMNMWHNTVLAIGCLIMLVAVPLAISNLYQRYCLDRFMQLKEGALKHIKLFGTNASAVKDEPNVCLTMPVDAIAFEVIYNWVSPYLDSKKLTLYSVPLKIHVQDETMRFDVLVIPLNQMKDDPSSRKAFQRECKIVGADSLRKLLGDTK
ncbi:hypothetical protein [Bifidobacterium gallicum]|uniref:Uncharacterized protein n=1 Tax=Bifidobacterium gallicum DSM 20093 = LMG 11596 TaxID=561180 RepID=D1NV79_9BIFI|nr:hypothetical protein [Bifidobacterium gallicum]EFA22730.1 hypothetical protein BIFGAL_03762 [Bifidobacterium gallicum DSM 20093 = LMG 11596]KFI59677.1 hypothetical protein BGLCM_0346 [Bifidobacterium gallicum DSM 20093 = LMG 11596]